MPVTNDSFDQLKIDKLKRFLEAQAEKGQPKPFEIFVDNLRVVPKTEDTKDFDNYDFYMNEDTEKVRILIYSCNTSPRNDQYCYTVQKNKGGLNGAIDVERIIKEKLEARDREHAANKVQKDLEETRTKLDEALEYIDILKEKLRLATDSKYKIKNLDMIEFGGTVLGNLIEKNPGILSRLGLEGFALDKTKSLPVPVDTEATFQKRPETDEDKELLSFLKELQEAFTEEELKSVFKILDKLMICKDEIAEVEALLNTKKQTV